MQIDIQADDSAHFLIDDLEARLRWITKHSAAQGQALGTAHNALMDANQVLGRCLEFLRQGGFPVPSLRIAIKDCQRVIDEAIEGIIS